MKIDKIDFLHNGKNISLSLIVEKDLSYLRQWKNYNKAFFFHSKEISENEQLKWYASYMLRENDFMFVVKNHESYIGCMGIRLIEENWDAYNIILGNSKFAKTGIMSASFQKMMIYAKQKKSTKITLNVLKKNPAVSWYIKQGLKIIKEIENYYKMEYIQ
jgi:hypothetical protein